jgi:hypothetical protein
MPGTLEVTTEEGTFDCRRLEQATGSYMKDPPHRVYCEGNESIGEQVKRVDGREVIVQQYSDHSGTLECNSVVDNDGDLMCIGETGMEEIRTNWQNMY